LLPGASLVLFLVGASDEDRERVIIACKEASIQCINGSQRNDAIHELFTTLKLKFDANAPVVEGSDFDLSGTSKEDLPVLFEKFNDLLIHLDDVGGKIMNALPDQSEFDRLRTLVEELETTKEDLERAKQELEQKLQRMRVKAAEFLEDDD
jgi:vacuolar-type H+-ATPase subunit I/STV1